MQLNLFTNITCSVCGCNPGLKPANPWLWNGFFFRDIKAHCCTQCRDRFYQDKSIKLKLPAGAMTYSEMPVIV